MVTLLLSDLSSALIDRPLTWPLRLNFLLFLVYFRAEGGTTPRVSVSLGPHLAGVPCVADGGRRTYRLDVINVECCDNIAIGAIHLTRTTSLL